MTVRVDPRTGKCQHTMRPETCAVCAPAWAQMKAAGTAPAVVPPPARPTPAAPPPRAPAPPARPAPAPAQGARVLDVPEGLTPSQQRLWRDRQALGRGDAPETRAPARPAPPPAPRPAPAAPAASGAAGNLPARHGAGTDTVSSGEPTSSRPRPPTTPPEPAPCPARDPEPPAEATPEARPDAPADGIVAWAAATPAGDGAVEVVTSRDGGDPPLVAKPGAILHTYGEASPLRDPDALPDPRPAERPPRRRGAGTRSPRVELVASPEGLAVATEGAERRAAGAPPPAPGSPDALLAALARTAAFARDAGGLADGVLMASIRTSPEALPALADPLLRAAEANLLRALEAVQAARAQLAPAPTPAP